MGKGCVVAAILLILRAVHAGVISHQHYQPAVYPRNPSVHKGIGRHIQPHVLEAYHSPFAGVRHPQRSLHGGLLVSRPLTVDVALRGSFRELHILHNLGRRRTRIGIHPRDSSIDSTLRYRLIAKQ